MSVYSYPVYKDRIETQIQDFTEQALDAKVKYDTAATRSSLAAKDSVMPILCMRILNDAFIFLLAIPEQEEYAELIGTNFQNIKSNYSEMKAYFAKRLLDRADFTDICNKCENSMKNVNDIYNKLLNKQLSTEVSDEFLLTDLKPKCQRCQKFKR